MAATILLRSKKVEAFFPGPAQLEVRAHEHEKRILSGNVGGGSNGIGSLQSEAAERPRSGD
jgi:hypothetical protein